jgi:cation diffusion facilitator CzcD-associated flavoprotein CzcO
MPDETKREKLTPKYSFGCKRVVKSSDYYPALALSHVKVHTDGIKEIKDSSIATSNGNTQKLDVGFNFQ